MVDCSGPNILIHADGLVCAPDKSAGEEGKEKHKSVDQLSSRSGHVKFVEEPVEVQEWRGKFV